MYLDDFVLVFFGIPQEANNTFYLALEYRTDISISLCGRFYLFHALSFPIP